MRRVVRHSVAQPLGMRALLACVRALRTRFHSMLAGLAQEGRTSARRREAVQLLLGQALEGRLLERKQKSTRDHSRDMLELVERRSVPRVALVALQEERVLRVRMQEPRTAVARLLDRSALRRSRQARSQGNTL